MENSKRNRRKWPYVCAAVFLLVLSICMIPMKINDFGLRRLENFMAGIPLPERTVQKDQMASVTRLGLAGDSLGYFVAIVIQSELTAEELWAYYSMYPYQGYHCRVDIQEEAYVAHSIAAYLSDEPFPALLEVEDFSGFYIVYYRIDGICSDLRVT